MLWALAAAGTVEPMVLLLVQLLAVLLLALQRLLAQGGACAEGSEWIGMQQQMELGPLG